MMITNASRRHRVLGDQEQNKLPIGSSATYLAPYRTSPKRRGPVIISYPEERNSSQNSRRIKWAENAKEEEEEEESLSSSSSSSSSSDSPKKTPPQRSAKQRQQQQKQQHQQQQQQWQQQQSEQQLQQTSKSESGDLQQKFEDMKRMTKEHRRREEDAYQKEIELKERIEQLEMLLKGTDTRARKWREGEEPPFIPGEQRRKIVKKESKYAVPPESLAKLKSPWDDIYKLRKNPTGLDCRSGPNPWHICKFCPGDCWHDGYNSAIALILFGLLGLMTYLVFGDVDFSVETSLRKEIQRTLCSLSAAFLRWR